jgi:hypothetical protein
VFAWGVWCLGEGESEFYIKLNAPTYACFLLLFLEELAIYRVPLL